MADLFAKIRKVFVPGVRRSLGTDALRIDTIGSTGGSSHVSVYNDTQALAISTVYRCVKLLSDSVAMLPMRMLTRGKNGAYEAETDTWLTYLLQVQPNERQSAYDFWRDAITHIYMQGNAYILPMRANYAANDAKPGGDIDRLVLLSRGSVNYDWVARAYTVNDTVNGISGTYQEREIIHLRGVSIDGRTGLGVVAYARKTFDVLATAEEETLQRFASGGNIRALVSDQSGMGTGYGGFDDAELERYAQKLENALRGDGRRLYYVPAGVNVKELVSNSADMQFLESRKFGVREVCRFFGVHPSFVFDDTSNNYKSAEMANVAYLSNTLNPLLRQIEGEFRRKLLRPLESLRIKFEFDRAELYACDLEARMRIQTQRIAAGLDTPNEARIKENKQPLEGGDYLMLSANLKPAGADIAEPTKDNKNDEEPTAD